MATRPSDAAERWGHEVEVRHARPELDPVGAKVGTHVALHLRIAAGVPSEAPGHVGEEEVRVSNGDDVPREVPRGDVGERVDVAAEADVLASDAHALGLDDDGARKDMLADLGVDAGREASVVRDKTEGRSCRQERVDDRRVVDPRIGQGGREGDVGEGSMRSKRPLFAPRAIRVNVRARHAGCCDPLVHGTPPRASFAPSLR